MDVIGTGFQSGGNLKVKQFGDGEAKGSCKGSQTQYADENPLLFLNTGKKTNSNGAVAPFLRRMLTSGG